MRKPGAAPGYIVGSAHAVTDAGEIIMGFRLRHPR
jgi:hypothetical protein